MRVSLKWLLIATAAVGCSSNTSPSDGGNGGGGGGPVGSITVGNDFFKSDHNGTTNAAVDTVAVGATVTWTWVNTGSVSHSVQSQGTPSFTSSAIQSGNGMTYTMMFTAPGTYQYDCAVHGQSMTGRIVVQ